MQRLKLACASTQSESDQFMQSDLNIRIFAGCIQGMYTVVNLMWSFYGNKQLNILHIFVHRIIYTFYEVVKNLQTYCEGDIDFYSKKCIQIYHCYYKVFKDLTLMIIV